MFVGGEENSAFFDAALSRPALLIDCADLYGDFDFFNRLAIHRNAEHNRLIVNAAVTRQIHLDDVFGIVIDSIFQFDGAVADFPDAVVTVDEAGFRKRVATDGARSDLFGGGKIFLHQGG